MKNILSLLVANLINTTPVPQVVVVGPNIVAGSKKRWSARLASDDTSHTPNDVLAVKDITTVLTSPKEDTSGCSYRAQGTIIPFEELPDNLRPVTFDKSYGYFRDANSERVKPTAAVFLPDGTVLAAY